MKTPTPERSIEVGDRVICDGLRTGQFGKVLGIGSSKHSIALYLNGDEIYEPDYCLLEVTTENKQAIELLLSHLKAERQKREEAVEAERERIADNMRIKINSISEMPNPSAHTTYGDTEYNNHAVCYGIRIAVDGFIEAVEALTNHNNPK